MLDDENAKVHRLVKVPLSELEVWDREHDVLGRRIPVSFNPANSSQGSNEYLKEKN